MRKCILTSEDVSPRQLSMLTWLECDAADSSDCAESHRTDCTSDINSLQICDPSEAPAETVKLSWQVGVFYDDVGPQTDHGIRRRLFRFEWITFWCFMTFAMYTTPSLLHRRRVDDVRYRSANGHLPSSSRFRGNDRCKAIRVKCKLLYRMLSKL